MKYKLITLLLLFLTAKLFASPEINRDNIYYQVYEAALKVRDDKNEGYSTIIKCAKTGEDIELSRAAIKVVILAMKKRRSKAITSFAKTVLTKFPGENMLGFLKETPLAKSCKKCRGSGKNRARQKCPACRGKKYISLSTAVPAELIKAIETLIKITPQLAADNGLYIGVSPKPNNTIKNDGDNFTPVTDADYAKAELLNYLKMQEKRSQSDIYKKCSVVKLQGKWTLLIIAGKDLLKMNKEVRQQTVDGFYKFWVLRAGS
ncbi:MAG: hypothetical protein HRT88_21140, partial [Lentisphaeraceae bacterium]|nr:hypothetical protein [Lentisphaeraceae bacterium]